MLVIVLIKVGHFLLLGVSGVRNHGDYTFIQLSFYSEKQLKDQGRINFSVIESKRKKNFGIGPP